MGNRINKKFMKLNYEQLKKCIGFDVKIDGEWWHVFGEKKENFQMIMLYRYDDEGFGSMLCSGVEVQKIRPKQPPKFKVGDNIRSINTGFVTTILDIYEDGDYKVLDCYGYEQKLNCETKIWIPHFDEPVREITKEEAIKLLEEAGHKNIVIK